MKATKKIFAALLAVMMIVMMIPATVSAAETYTANITGKDGYTATVYKVADLDTTTGTYSNAVAGLSDILNSKVSNNGINSAALLDACEALTTLPASVATLTFSQSALTQTFETAQAGVYYIKVTGTPAGISVKKTGGAVLSLPYYSSNAWNSTVDASLKIEDGTVSIDKKIVEGTQRVTSTTANIGDTITYELTASTAGSVDQKLTEYTIHDNLSSHLTYSAVTSVKLDNRTLTAAEYTVTANNQADITIALAASVLNGTEFYSASNVVVTLTAVLNNTAIIGKVDGNSNSDSLTYTNAYGQQTVQGPTVQVYTFELTVKKVDAKTGAALAGAKFTVYTDAACSTVAKNGAEATTDANGLVKYTGLNAGTYYVKETAAPTGYNLNAQVVTVTISKDGVVTSSALKDGNVVVEDTPIVMPATGGTGTMIFTVIGISLIACAGILLVVLKKKSTK